MKINPDKLLLTSNFYTIQGEGISSGIPAYFLRLAHCDLSCGFSKKFLNEIVKKQKESNGEFIKDGEVLIGDLEQQKVASWSCDSFSQWALRGESRDFQWVLDQWKAEGIYDEILRGEIRIILTGGEPTIAAHQESIINFYNYWLNNYIQISEGSKIISVSADKKFTTLLTKDKTIVSVFFSPYFEIETNGRNYIKDELFQILGQINCSPKLSNSGMEKKQRIVPESIERIKKHKNYQLKFVISTEEDIKEIYENFVTPFKIPNDKIVCMPGMDSQDEFFERTKWCFEMAKKYKFRGMTRNHIAAWSQTLNV